MRAILKWFLIALGVLLGVVFLGMAILYFKGIAMTSRKHEIVGEAIAIPTDAASIERGRHFAQAALRKKLVGSMQQRYAALENDSNPNDLEEKNR